MKRHGSPTQPHPTPSRPHWPWHCLTAREQQVLALLTEGASRHAIADTLGLSHWTVTHYIQTIVSKLGVRNYTHAACLAVALEVCDLPDAPGTPHAHHEAA